MKHTKKITILHSNDLHGDFLAEQVDEKLVGGVSMLSGYIEKGTNHFIIFSLTLNVSSLTKIKQLK